MFPSVSYSVAFRNVFCSTSLPNFANQQNYILCKSSDLDILMTAKARDTQFLNVETAAEKPTAFHGHRFEGKRFDDCVFEPDAEQKPSKAIFDRSGSSKRLYAPFWQLNQKMATCLQDSKSQ